MGSATKNAEFPIYSEEQKRRRGLWPGTTDFTIILDILI